MKPNSWVYEFSQPISVRIHVLPEGDSTPDVDVTRLFRLEGLRWAIDMPMVPGPDEVQ